MAFYRYIRSVYVISYILTGCNISPSVNLIMMFIFKTQWM